ncbi:hypothetical protein T484DRAFT_2646756 [Baffinella frigidus]|nr:hypothetical protein T484DRAFT_2646756 [Cryptophyta sp. CCMP2293]
MGVHILTCEHERVTCLCPGCDTRVLRRNMDAHIESRHLGEAVQLLQNAWSNVARVEERELSQQRHATDTPTTWEFNWRAEGWGVGPYFVSETHDFGAGVTGKCCLFLRTRRRTRRRNQEKRGRVRTSKSLEARTSSGTQPSTFNPKP